LSFAAESKENSKIGSFAVKRGAHTSKRDLQTRLRACQPARRRSAAMPPSLNPPTAASARSISSAQLSVTPPPHPRLRLLRLRLRL
jgi:hypothetical protein